MGLDGGHPLSVDHKEIQLVAWGLRPHGLCRGSIFGGSRRNRGRMGFAHLIRPPPLGARVVGRGQADFASPRGSGPLKSPLPARGPGIHLPTESRPSVEVSMRAVLNTALLLLAFAVGQAGAAELTAAQAQQIMGAAQQAPAGGAAVEVKLTIDGNEVVFTVTRDRVGNIIARPVSPPGTATGGIAQASIGSTVANSGALVANSLVQVNALSTIFCSCLLSFFGG